MSQNINTCGYINLNVRLGTKTQERRKEEEMFVVYSRSSLGKIFKVCLACGITKD
jgi:hypothetical protein